PAPELSGVRDWRPEFEADNRRQAVFLRPHHWLRAPMGGAGGGALTGSPTSTRYANPAGPRSPDWRRAAGLQPLSRSTIMGSKSVLAPAVACAPFRSPRRPSLVRARRWHPVVYLADRGPVRFAGRATMRE